MLAMIGLFTGLSQETQALANNERPTVAVLNIDTRGLNMDPVQMGNLVRLELNKLGLFDVMDKYDAAYLIDKLELEIENCYGKICMVEVGKQLGMDKMLTGNVELLGDVILVDLRLVDVATGSVESSQVLEFLELNQQVQMMISLTLHKLFGLEVDEDVLNKLTQKFDFENTLNFPETDRLKLDGPRSGLTFYSGETAKIYRQSKEEGGFDGPPVLFQFGYQFEIKYLNEGRFQALFEFLPIITGLDQGRFIPSISLLNGLRDNKGGWEFAFGPIFYMTREARGYYDAENVWHLEYEWWEAFPDGEPNPYTIESRLDSRGDAAFGTGFVIGVGKTFKSGRLNIPVNAFFIPDNEGHRFGISVGFNADKMKKRK
ncbi:MAG: hypothetical protein GYB31_01685 [Bacteroidetes bacterium]|nr:hypothetical protein [Bacteroidota bacterium]